MVRRQLAAGSRGVSIGGSTGEPAAQSIAERAAAIRTEAGEVADAVPFLPGATRMQFLITGRALFPGSCRRSAGPG
jgi:dihydrodipicolinate synthase/N-acetylneuraminate lyase